MTSLIEIIRGRRSVRKYKDAPVEKKSVDLILEAARLSPTARNAQELRYKVITDRTLISQLSEETKNIIRKENPSFPLREAPLFYDAPLLIIITGPKDNSWVETDAALAVQNIMLQATELGLGSCFIGMAKFMEKDRNIMDLARISDGQMIAAAVICGYPDEEPTEKEKKMDADFFY
jgi:nitroreductase